MYKLLVTTEAMANSGLQAILRDTYSAVTNNTPLNMEGKTDIFFTVNADPASFAANRFSIIFEKAAPLPVVFETVKACKQQKDVVVQWQCTNEINIKNYEVQSSLNGTTFIKAGTLPAKANNGGNATYNFIDTNAVNGLHYYRIKSTGLNGSEHYSIIVKVNTAGTSGALSVYPNPLTGGLINLQFKNMESGQYKLRLIDINGQQVLNTTFMHPGGSATEKIKLSKYIAKGIYQFEITNPLNGITVINVVNQ